MLDRPKIESWMTTQEIVFRQSFDGLVDTINIQKLAPKKIDEYQIFESGQSSVVALANPNTPNQFILKTAIESEDIVSEAIALGHWKNVVKTPQIFNLHTPDNSLPVAFFTQEFIQTQRLKDLLSPEERIHQGFSQEIGRQLALIHSLPLPDDVSQITQKNISEIVKQIKKLNTEDNQNVNKAINIIASISDSELKLCDNDFLPYNILLKDGHDLIVFDPDASITHPMADLANTLLNTLAEVKDFGQLEAQEILKGYESVTKIDYKILNAFFTFQCVRKTDSWARKDKDKKSNIAKDFIDHPPAFLRK